MSQRALLATGATRGIGRAIALRAATSGWSFHVGAFDDDPHDADTLVKEIMGAGERPSDSSGVPHSNSPSAASVDGGLTVSWPS
ncbi:NAD(P)-dependent dehydrogenase (short-subunit alcohol dehydrogenase family) [Arthrobacter sp. GAS37]|uniref:hypothetical protein n=1 Tax=Arthrobacter sp. GAS37 TaxID=3156261 RepID=UPI0038341ECD